MQLEEQCKPKCTQYLVSLKQCEERIKKDTTGTFLRSCADLWRLPHVYLWMRRAAGEAHCTGQAFDYWKCIDKCVAPKLFAKLK